MNIWAMIYTQGFVLFGACVIWGFIKAMDWVSDQKADGNLWPWRVICGVYFFSMWAMITRGFYWVICHAMEGLQH